MSNYILSMQKYAKRLLFYENSCYSVRIMKRQSEIAVRGLFVRILFCAVAALSFALDNKTSVSLGVTPLEKEKGGDLYFGGAYLLLDSVLSNNYVIIGGKIYYRLSEASSWEELSRKLDIKKAYIKLRPLGTADIELAAGRLYSYYLPGAFFSLTETYTGASRWGKTGVGMKFSKAGFTGGLGLPLTEDMELFDDTKSLAGGLSYNVASAYAPLPLQAGCAVSYEDKKQTDKKSGKTSRNRETAYTFSLYYTPRLEGFVHDFSAFAAYSYNASPYVASTAFKPVSNYKSVGRAQFASFSFKLSLGQVQLLGEGELGKSLDADIVPFYTGLQLFVPLTEQVALKPRFFYYAAYNTEHSAESRQTFEFYPRLWITQGRATVSLGFDVLTAQVAEKEYQWSWKMPLYLELKVQ